MLQALIGPIANLAGQWFSNKMEQGKAKHEARLEKIKNDADWEARMADGSVLSWKDEWWTIVLSLPVIVLMVGVGLGDQAIVEKVKEVFSVLNTLPEWYQYLLYIAVLSSFGIKGVDKMMNFKK